MARISSIGKAKEIYRGWNDIDKGEDRNEWIGRWRKNWDFRIGNQWTGDESKDLKNNGMIDYVVNRLRPAYRYMKNTIMAKRPIARLSSVRGADTEAVTQFQRLIKFFWQISNGIAQCNRMLDPYLDGGMGILMLYEDNDDDYGRGELKFKEISPDYLYIPRYARDIQFDDAKEMFFCKPITVEEAYDSYGRKAKISIDTLRNNGMGTSELCRQDSYYGPEREVLKKQLDTNDVTDTDYILLIERTKKIKQDMIFYNVSTEGSQREHIYLVEPDVDIGEYLESKNIGLVDILGTEETVIGRIRREVILGESLYIPQENDVLPISHHPYAFCTGEDMRNPFPIGETHFSIGQQKMINHLHSLIVFIGQTLGVPSTIVREGIFRNSKHKTEVQKNRAVPNYIWEVYNAPEGRPLTDSIMVNQSVPPPAILSDLMQFNLQQIDNNTGIFPIKMGDPSSAPRTADATARIGEWGDVTMQGPILALHICFERLFNLYAQWAPNYYTIEKLFEVVEGRKKDLGHINALNEDTGDALYDIRNLEAKVYVDVGSFVSVSKITNQLLYKELSSVAPEVFLKLFIRNDDNIDEDEKQEIEHTLDRLPQLEQELANVSEQYSELEKVLASVDSERLQAEERIHIERLRGNLKQFAEKYKAQVESKEKGNGKRT